MMSAKEKKLYNTGLILLIILSVLASVSKIFTGFDIDEGYAVVMPARLVKGDLLFKDMWEVHQTSSFLPYIFIKLFASITGSYESIVLYLRIVTLMIHALMSVLIFLYFKKRKDLIPELWTFGSLLPLLFVILYFNFLPKWMLNLDFSMQQLWFFTLFCGFFSDSVNGVKYGRSELLPVILSGISLSFDVLSYPGMVILFPVAFIILLKKDVKKSVCLFFSCLIPAVIFFCILLSYLSPAELLSDLSMVFMDGSHQFNFSQKAALYTSQWGSALLEALILLVPSVIVGEILYRLLSKNNAGFLINATEPAGSGSPSGSRMKVFAKTRFPIYSIVFEGAYSILIVFAFICLKWGPFRLQVRYIIQFFAIFPIIFLLLNRNIIIWGYLQFFAYLGILISSNVGPVSSASYLVCGNLLFAVLLPVLSDRLTDSSERGVLMRHLSITCAFLFSLSLIMCRGFYMRNTEYVPGNITDPLERISEGPLKGICLTEDDAGMYKEAYDVISRGSSSSDRILFMGTQTLCLLFSDSEMVIPTTISTPAFNEQWREYFVLHPDKMPTVIYISKSTIDNRDKFFEKNPFGIFLAENYDVSSMEETDHLCILRR